MPDNFARYAEEFNRLLVEHGFATRIRKYVIPDDSPEQDRAFEARTARLVELAQLILPRADPAHPDRDPIDYVDDRLVAWLAANPLMLTTDILSDHISRVGESVGVMVDIGDPRKVGGHSYTCRADDLSDSHGLLRLRVPDTVAEHFRQQGRRAVQREVADVLAIKSHL